MEGALPSSGRSKHTPEGLAPERLTKRLLEEAQKVGFDPCGVTAAVEAPHTQMYENWLDRGFHGEMEYLRDHQPLKVHPESLLPGVQSIVAVGLNYRQENPPEVGKPHIASYALGRDYHRVLKGKLRKLATWLAREVPESRSRPCVDSAPIFERDYARLAGLGWFGKNTMLINSQRGSWFFIGLLLTTVELEPSRPAMGGCGTCQECIKACPTGAIVFEDGRWQVDARSCVSYLTIEHRGEIPEALSAKMKDWTFGCDVCQEVCPFNQPRENAPLRAQNTEEEDFRATRQWPSLSELAEISWEDWDRLTQGSAVRRTGWEGLRRNAKINLG
jgi:epoxyqueuosine reductase